MRSVREHFGRCPGITWETFDREVFGTVRNRFATFRNPANTAPSLKPAMKERVQGSDNVGSSEPFGTCSSEPVRNDFKPVPNHFRRVPGPVTKLAPIGPGATILSAQACQIFSSTGGETGFFRASHDFFCKPHHNGILFLRETIPRGKRT